MIFKRLHFLLFVFLLNINTESHAITMEAIFTESDGSVIGDTEKYHRIHAIYRDLQYSAIYGEGVPNFKEALEGEILREGFTVGIKFIPTSLWELCFLAAIATNAPFNPQSEWEQAFMALNQNTNINDEKNELAEKFKFLDLIDYHNHSDGINYNATAAFDCKPDEPTIDEAFGRLADYNKHPHHSLIKHVVDSYVINNYAGIDDQDLWAIHVSKMVDDIKNFHPIICQYKLNLHYGLILGFNYSNSRMHFLNKEYLIGILKTEKNAFESNQLLLLRGTRMLNMSRQVEMVFELQDSTMNDNILFGIVIRPNVHSNSYGLSYYSGLVSHDSTASVSHYCSTRGECALYALSLDLPLSKEAKEIFFIPPLLGAMSMRRHGDFAHPRSKLADKETQASGLANVTMTYPIKKTLQSSYDLNELTIRYTQHISK